MYETINLRFSLSRGNFNLVPVWNLKFVFVASYVSCDGITRNVQNHRFIILSSRGKLKPHIFTKS